MPPRNRTPTRRRRSKKIGHGGHPLRKAFTPIVRGPLVPCCSGDMFRHPVNITKSSLGAVPAPDLKSSIFSIPSILKYQWRACKCLISQYGIHVMLPEAHTISNMVSPLAPECDQISFTAHSFPRVLISTTCSQEQPGNNLSSFGICLHSSEAWKYIMDTVLNQISWQLNFIGTIFEISSNC